MADFLKITYDTYTFVRSTIDTNLYKPKLTSNIQRTISDTNTKQIFILDYLPNFDDSYFGSKTVSRTYNLKIYKLYNGTTTALDSTEVEKLNTLLDTNFTRPAFQSVFSHAFYFNYRDNLADRYGEVYIEHPVLKNLEVISDNCILLLTTNAWYWLNYYGNLHGTFYELKPYTVDWVRDLGYSKQLLRGVYFKKNTQSIYYNQLDDIYVGRDSVPLMPEGETPPFAWSWISPATNYQETFNAFNNQIGSAGEIKDTKYIYDYASPVFTSDTDYNNICQVWLRLLLANNYSNFDALYKSKYNYLRYTKGNQYHIHYDMDLNDNLIRAKLTSSEQIRGNKDPLYYSSSHSVDSGKTTTITPEYALHIYTYRYDADSDKYLFIKHTQTDYFDGASVDVNFTQEVLTGLNNTPEYQYTRDKYDTNLYAEFYNILQLVLYKHTKESYPYYISGVVPVDKYEVYYNQPIPKSGNLTVTEFEDLKNTNLMYANTITIANCPDVFTNCNLTASTQYEHGELSIAYIYDEPQRPEEPKDVDPQEPDDTTKYPTPKPPIGTDGKIPEPIPPVPPTPTNKLTYVDSLYKIYKLTRLEVGSLGSFLWNEEWVDLLKPLQTNPMENIISLKRSCFDVPTGESKVNILIGNVDTGVSAYPVYEQYTSVIGSFEFKGKYNSFLDFAPFTQYYVYLPFVGKKEIDPNLCLNHTLTISVVVDVTTLISRYVIKNENNVVIAEYEFDSGMDLPLSGTDATQKAISIGTNLISTGARVVGDAMIGNIGGAVADGVSGLVSSVMSQVNTTTDGRPSANTSLLCDRTVYVEIHRPTYQYISTYAHTKGYPCSVARDVSSLSGFTTFDDSIDISGVSATTTEIEQLKSILTSGVYL